ncbi:MAG: helix-turn-helix domain-containing protein [Thermodesulfobacteriota bacterium]
MKAEAQGALGSRSRASGEEVLNSRIGQSIDLLVDYLLDNAVEGIYPLVIREVERRILAKALERSRGNKLQAAKLLGISRNTFRRKIRELVDGRTN